MVKDSLEIQVISPGSIHAYEAIHLSRPVSLPSPCLSPKCTPPQRHLMHRPPPVANHHTTVLRTYPQAWVALFCIVFLRISIALFQFTYSAIPGLTGQYFGVSLMAVNWLAIILCGVYVVLSFFTEKIFEYSGLKIPIMLAGFFNLLGAGIRCIGATTQPPSFIVTVLGQLIGALAGPLTLNILTNFVSMWFTERLRAMAGMLVASNYGAIIGMFVIPTITVSTEYIPYLLYGVTIISFVAFVGVILMPAQPPIPLSYLKGIEKSDFLKSLRILSKNHQFWILFFIHGLNVGVCIAFNTLLPQLISPYGYTDIDAGQLNAISFLFGILGCLIAGVIWDNTRQHVLLLRLTAPMVLVADVGMIHIIDLHSYSAMMIVMSTNQFFLSFLVPIVIELAGEISYPAAESTASSVMWQGAQMFGFLFILIMGYLGGPSMNIQGSFNLHHALVLQALVATVMVALTFIYKEPRSSSERVSEARVKSNQLPVATLRENMIFAQEYTIPAVSIRE
ncbi:major facilitator superfamily domain-containing protein [Spinellus fusiger]|nr:major facilitator superfamily domain-containing protein [Spinellus fusiger]